MTSRATRVKGVWGEAARVPPSEEMSVVTRHADEGGGGEAETRPPSLLIVLAILVGLLAATTADAQLPKQVTLATNPPGTAYYAVASGLAKVVSSHAGYQMVVQPYTGTSTMLPLLNTGEVDFAGVQERQHRAGSRVGLHDHLVPGVGRDDLGEPTRHRVVGRARRIRGQCHLFRELRVSGRCREQPDQDSQDDQ